MGSAASKTGDSTLKCELTLVSPSAMAAIKILVEKQIADDAVVVYSKSERLFRCVEADC
jgi:hypothetical protein